jgi:hypothetical protein
MQLIQAEMAIVGESVDDICDWRIAPGHTFEDEFYAGYGSSRGAPFTLWTMARVYFPVTYDGKESVKSVPRDPCDELTDHVGGE